MSRPRLLDLFCGAGGAARGYQLAGFHVTGVDINPQPRYAGDAFIQGDALAYVAEHGHEFDAIHASPPCQAHSIMRHLHPTNEHPDLVPVTRKALIKTGLPYVIENVVGAPLLSPFVLCGAMFGLRVYRHRLFESPSMILTPAHQAHTVPCGERGKIPSPDQFVVVTGRMTQRLYFARAQTAMGIDWMNRYELSQAIPPAYTRFIGAQLLASLDMEAAS